VEVYEVDSDGTPVQVPVLRVVPLQGEGGILTVVAQAQVQALNTGGSTVFRTLPKYSVIACDEELSPGSVQVLHDGAVVDQETILDAVPVVEENQCVLLGSTLATEVGTTALGTSVTYLSTEYWLQTASLDRSLSDKVAFLSGTWPVLAEDNRARVLQSAQGRVGDRYVPVALGGGMLGPLGRFLVVAIRYDAARDPRGAALPDTLLVGLSALFVDARSLRVVEEVVFRSVLTGYTPAWQPRIRCSGINSREPLWHVGVQQDPLVAESAPQLAVHAISADGVFAGPFPHAVLWTDVTLAQSQRPLDFDLAAERLDTGRLRTWGALETESLIVISLPGAAAGTTQLSAVRYTDFNEELVGTAGGVTTRPQLVTPLGSSLGMPRLAIDGTRGSRYHLADYHLDIPSGASRRELRLRRLGGSGATYQQHPDSVPPWSTTSDIGLAFDPGRQAVFRAVHTRKLTPNGTFGSAIDLRVEVTRSYGLTLTERSRSCAEIGPIFSARYPMLPEPGQVPAIGNRYFEVELRGGPANTSVTLVVTSQPPADYEGCSVRLTSDPTLSDSFRTVTDGAGWAVVSVPLGALGLPTLFPRSTPAFGARGEILSHPLVLFAQWQWVSHGPDEDVDPGIGSGMIHPILWVGSRILTILPVV